MRQRRHDHVPAVAGEFERPDRGRGQFEEADDQRDPARYDEGRNVSAPMISTVPSSRNPNVIVSVRRVPDVKGTFFFAARPAANAIGAKIGM